MFTESLGHSLALFIFRISTNLQEITGISSEHFNHNVAKRNEMHQASEERCDYETAVRQDHYKYRKNFKLRLLEITPIWHGLIYICFNFLWLNELLLVKFHGLRELKYQFGWKSIDLIGRRKWYDIYKNIENNNTFSFLPSRNNVDQCSLVWLSTFLLCFNTRGLVATSLMIVCDTWKNNYEVFLRPLSQWEGTPRFLSRVHRLTYSDSSPLKIHIQICSSYCWNISMQNVFSPSWAEYLFTFMNSLCLLHFFAQCL